MKQTAVEWLESKLDEFETIYDSLPTSLYEYVQHAKEMEKQQLIDAHNLGMGHYGDANCIVDSEKYYKETFLNK